MKIYSISILFLLVSFVAKPQQLPVNDHYFSDPYLMNPSKAGSNPGTNIFLLNRQQWIDIQGAPKTTLFSVDGSFNSDKVGLGLIFSNDADNIFSRTAFYGTYSYHVKIGNEQRLSMALSLGLMNARINFDELEDNYITDPSIISVSGTATKFDATAGINYRFKKLEIGLVGYQLAGSKYKYSDRLNFQLNYQLIQHFLMVVNYKFRVMEDKLTITPNLIVRTALGLPAQLDLGVNTNYNNRMWSGIGYRQNSCIYLNLGGVIYNNITLSGAYEFNMGNIRRFSGPSFEVVLGYRINNGKSKATSAPVLYNDRKDIENINRTMQAQSESIDKITYENNVLKKEIKKNNEEITALKEEIDRFKELIALTAEEQREIEQFKEKYEVKIEDNRQVTDTGSNSVIPDSSEFSENKELKVIVGAYKTIKQAKLGQQVLMREYGLETFIIKDPESSFYFIAFDKFKQYDDINKEFNRLKKMGIEKTVNGNIWLYKAR